MVSSRPEPVPSAGWWDSAGGRSLREEDFPEIKVPTGAKSQQWIYIWHQHRAIADRKGRGRRLRDSQSPHGDGHVVGVRDHTVEEHDCVCGEKQLEGGAPSITKCPSIT